MGVAPAVIGAPKANAENAKKQRTQRHSDGERSAVAPMIESNSHLPTVRRPGWRLGVLVIVLAAFALRVYALDTQELRGDEAFGHFFSQRSFGDIISATIGLKEPHPVASYFVQNIWLKLTGDSEFALRFLGVWWGVLAVALLFRLGRRLDFRPWPVALAALLLAISPYAIWHSQDARMYAMSLAVTTATVLVALEALQSRRTVWATAYIAAALLALHTHYYAVFVLLALNLFVIGQAILVPRTRALLKSWLLWQAIVSILYVPWILRAGFILSGYGGNGDSPGLFDALQRTLAVFAVGESTPPDQRMWWALAAAPLLAIGIVRLAVGSGDDRRTLSLLVLYLCVPLLAIWISALQRPIFNERYLVTALPPFYLLVAAAFGRRRRGGSRGSAIDGAAGLLVAIFIAGSLLSLNRNYSDPAYSKTRGWRDLAAAITRLSAGFAPERVRVAQNFPDPTLWYYYRGPVDHVVLPPAANSGEAARTAVEALARQGVQRVILPIQPASNWDNSGLAMMALDGWFDRAAQTQVGVWPLQVYAQPPGALTPVGVDFANGVTLRGAVTAPETLAPGELLTVHLDWIGATPVYTGTEKVFVQLLDASGQLVAQDDRPLLLSGPRAAGTGLAVYGIQVPAELGTGPYRLIAGLYDPGQSGAPRILTEGGADHVVLHDAW